MQQAPSSINLSNIPNMQRSRFAQTVRFIKEKPLTRGVGAPCLPVSKWQARAGTVHGPKKAGDRACAKPPARFDT